MHEALSIATPLESTSTPVRWLEVEAVAARLGVSVRRVRQLAAETWLAQRLAKLERSDGYRPRWLIADAADPRLAIVQFPDAMPSDVEKLSDDQRRIALQKKLILDGWMSARAAGYRQNKTERQITDAYVLQVQADHNVSINRRTLFGWYKLYRLDGLNGLMDGRWKQARAADPGGEDEFYKLFDRLYLNLRAPTAKSSWDAACMIAADRGIETRSYKQTLRHVEKIPLAVRVKCREGERAYQDKIAPYTQRDYSQLAVNEWWNSDHHRCDVMVEHEGKYVRPWLTCWQDLRSRKIVGWSIYAHDPNADVILRCFVDAAAACGVPRVVYIDNGRDYDSRALQGITKKQRRTAASLGESDRQKIGGAFGMLNIDVHHALPYHAQSKPIERFFGTLESRFGKSFETYCGKDPQSKPEDLPKQLAAGKAPKLAEFAGAFAAWLAADYNAQPHSGDAMDGQSPDQVFESLRGEIKTAPRDLLLFATLPRVGPVKIGQHGVRWEGINYGSGTPDLQKRFGQKVMLAIDDRDIERVLILDLEGRLICTAPLNKQLPFGATKQDMRETMAAQKRDRRRQQEYFDRQPRMAEDRLAALTRRTVEKKRVQGLPPGAEPPPIIKPIRLPFEDQSRQIAAALGEKPMRLAAGAESMHNGREVFMDAVMSRHDAGDVDRAGDRGFMDALAMAVTSTRRDGQ